MTRLPTHLEVSALIRSVEAGGGFAMVLAKGERDAGTLLLVLLSREEQATAYERMPRADGTRGWTAVKTGNPAEPQALNEYLDRRKRQDHDLWIVELDVRDRERFIEALLNS